MATTTDIGGQERELIPESQPEQPERRGGLTAVSLFLVLLIGYMLMQVQFILILILVSLVLATALASPVQFLEKRLMIPRGLAILLLYLSFIGVLVLFGFLIAPSVREQVDIFVDQAPIRLADLRADWQSSSNPLLNGTGQELLGSAIGRLEDPPEPQQETAVNVLTSAVGGIIGLFATLVITFYYLMERSFIRTVILNEISPRMQQRVARIWDDAEAKVGGWLRGQLTLCLIIGVVAAIGYGIIGVPFWPVLGIWAAITEIIPVLGPWLGGIPAVILALTVSFEMALITTIFVVFLQMTENWVLVPRVMRGAVGLTPLTVFIAITAGAEFYGIVGTLLAIPIAAFVQVIVTTFLDERRDSKQPRPGRGPIPAWRWMRVSSRDGDPRGATGNDPAGSATGIPMATAPSGMGPTGSTSTVTAPPIGRYDRRAAATQSPAPASAAPAPARGERPSGTPPAPTGRATAGVAHRPDSAPIGPASQTTGSRPAVGPKWTAEQLRRSAAPGSATGAVEDDEPPAPTRPAAIGPGDQ